MKLNLILSAAVLALSFPSYAQDTAGLDAAEFKGRPYSPYADRAFPTNVYFGDTHVHTGLSADALKFNYPDLFFDPLMRVAALGRMGKVHDAQNAVEELLELEPDFSCKGRKLIGKYLKVPELIDKIIEGLIPSGLKSIN